MVGISLVGEIHHSCSGQQGAADLATSSQLSQCVQVIQDTNQYDANDTQVPEISVHVPWQRPHAVGDEEKQEHVQSELKNIGQNGPVAQRMSACPIRI